MATLRLVTGRFLAFIRAHWATTRVKRAAFTEYSPSAADFRKMHWLPTCLSAARPVAGLVMALAIPRSLPWATKLYYFFGYALFEWALDIADGAVARRLQVNCLAGGSFDLLCDVWGNFFVLGFLSKAMTGELKFTLVEYSFGAALIWLFLVSKRARRHMVKLTWIDMVLAQICCFGWGVVEIHQRFPTLTAKVCWSALWQIHPFR